MDRWIGDHDRSLDRSVDPCRSPIDRDRPAITSPLTLRTYLPQANILPSEWICCEQ